MGLLNRSEWLVAAAGTACGVVMVGAALILLSPSDATRPGPARAAASVPVTPVTPLPRPQSEAPKALWRSPDPSIDLPPESITPPPMPEPAWQRFAVATAPPDGRPMIAIVIDDMGVDLNQSPRAIRLRAPLTLSFLPYARHIAKQARTARDHGHELMVHVSMEPEDPHADPGANPLLTSLQPAELRRRLDWALSRFDGYTGINNHMGSRFTADADGMLRVLVGLKSRGLLFLDSRTTSESVAPRIAHQIGLPFLQRDLFLDNEPDPDRIRANLDHLERLAREHGTAIGIGHPRETTIDTLGPWLKGLEARGVRLVPLSALVRQRTGQG